jgi:hypothetical protein
MTLEEQVTAIQNAVNDPNTGLVALSNQIKAIPASQPVDLSAINSQLATIAAGIADIQAQVDQPAAAAPAAPATGG